MFISAGSLGWQVVIPIVVCVIVQMPIAMFCLYKLARVDQPLSRYILWNIFIIVVFFIGDAVFLIYYYKSKNIKLIDMPPPVACASGEAEGAPEQLTEDEPERENGEAEGSAAAATARESQSEVPAEGDNQQTTVQNEGDNPDENA